MTAATETASHSRMTFGRGLVFSYRESLAFCIACPMLFLVPVAAELLQHVIEVQVGMYASPESAASTEAHPMRMGFGFLKVTVLLLPIYWATRFAVLGRDRAAAARLDRPAAGQFALFFLVMAAINAASLFLVPREGAVAIAVLLGGLVWGPLLARWGAGSALGLAAHPGRLIRQMVPVLPWTIAFMLVAILPLMIVHYALGIGAIFAPPAALWPMLITDSLVVGWLSALVALAGYVAALRAGPLPEPRDHA